MKGKLIAIEADPISAKVQDKSGRIWTVPVEDGSINLDMLGGDVGFVVIITAGPDEPLLPKTKRGPGGKRRVYRVSPSSRRRAKLPPPTEWQTASEWSASVGISSSRYYQIRHLFDEGALKEFASGKSTITMVRAGTPRPKPLLRKAKKAGSKKEKAGAKVSARWNAFPTAKEAWQQKIAAFDKALEPGWIRASVYAQANGISTKVIVGLCSNGTFPDGATRKVPVGASKVAKWWVILEATPPPPPKARKVKATASTSVKVIPPRNVEPPKAGDGANGRAVFILELDAAIKALSGATGSAPFQKTMFKLLIQNFGLTSMAKRFGVTTKTMKHGLVTAKQVSKALRIAKALRREMSRQLAAADTGGFAMPERK